MRHRKKGKKLSRKKAHRDHLARNLATQLFTHGRIKTTLSKAKFVKPFVDKIVTISKKDTPSAKRKVSDILFSQEATENVLDKFQDDFSKRDSGYTRIIRLKQRPGDGGQLAILDLLISDDKKNKESKQKKQKEDSKSTKAKSQDGKDKGSFWDRFKGDDQQAKKKKPVKSKKTSKKESTQRTTSK